jgi:hypothetical protein
MIPAPGKQEVRRPGDQEITKQIRRPRSSA